MKLLAIILKGLLLGMVIGGLIAFLSGVWIVLVEQIFVDWMRNR